MSAEEMIVGVAGWLGPILSTCITAYVAAMVRSGEAKRDEARAETDAKRRAEAEWRNSIEERLDHQNKRIDAVLKGQTTQMRSDILHKAHRYIDDLGCASTEEKEALWAEWEDYAAICDANNITNHFIDKLVNQAMALPNRGES